MDERTLTVIAICKGNTKYDDERSFLGPIKNFLVEDCGGKKEDYTDEDAISVLKTAAMDYMNACDRPGYFFEEILRYSASVLPMHVCIIYAFKNVQVRKHKPHNNSYEYINGFSHKYFEIKEEIKCQNSK